MKISCYCLGSATCSSPIVHKAHCVPGPLCPKPTVSQAQCPKPTVSKAQCPRPIMSQVHNVPGPMCPSPTGMFKDYDCTTKLGHWPWYTMELVHVGSMGLPVLIKFSGTPAFVKKKQVTLHYGKNPNTNAHNHCAKQARERTQMENPKH